MNTPEHATADPFAPWTLGGLTLRNRIIKTATFEGLTPKGVPGERLARFHEKFAKGGAGVVTVAYGAVNADARTFDDQMCMRDDVIEPLQMITERIKSHGAAASIQLAHCGFQTKYSRLSSKPFSKGPSRGINRYGLFAGIPFIKPYKKDELVNIAADYGASALRAKEAGFDLVELHMGHGYLFSQFLCLKTNKRDDEFGGSVQNRLRFPLMALRKVREALGRDMPIIVKMNVADGFKGGLTTEEAVEIAETLEKDGAASLLELSGGFSSINPMYLFRGKSPIKPLIAAQKNPVNKLIYSLAAKNFPDMPFEEMYFLERARRVRSAVKMPVGLVGGIKSLASINAAMSEGFDAAVMGRALIHEPDLINQYQAGLATQSGCISCNRCVAGIDGEDGVVCPIVQEALQEAA